ncbi:MAG: GNAT family N-acetyltransferase [Haloferacaceae archaeon]
MSRNATVRAGTPADHLDVMRILDGAMLDVDAETVRSRLERSPAAVLVAECDAVVGALVLDGTHVDAVAVRRSRRGRGVGTALVEAAAARVDGALTADFDPRVSAFYESVGFEIAARDGRLWGTYERGGADS